MKGVTVARRMGLRSMRTRMTVLFACFVALLMLGCGAAVHNREHRRSVKRTVELLSFGLDRAHEEIRGAPKGTSLVEVIRPAAREVGSGGLSLIVLNARDKVLWSSVAGLSWPLDTRDWRDRSLLHNGQTLIVARELGPLRAELHELDLGLCGLGLLVVSTTAALAWTVVGRTLAPLERLADQARDASSESLQVRLRSPSSDLEMRRLTATLNDLLSRLEREANARGRFYAAASHELRTPIQMLLGHIDVARSRPRSAAEYEAVLAQVQGHTERLAILVQDLLQLNSLEMGQNRVPRERVNLAHWVERALESVVELGQRGDLRLLIDLQDADVPAPPHHLEVLLRNLLENACKYAAPGTDVAVTLEMAGSQALLRVKNYCPLPVGTDPAQWFEPFFRPDESRNSGTGGNGLGLAIAASIARANGWKLSLMIQGDFVVAEVQFELAAAS